MPTAVVNAINRTQALDCVYQSSGSLRPLSPDTIRPWTSRFPPTTAPSTKMSAESRLLSATTTGPSATRPRASPHEFHRAMADAGWLGITMPVELGGAGLGVTEAAIMMHAVARGGGGYAAASSIHLNIFGPHAIVVHGTEEQKQRMLPPLIKGEQKACFGVTEPNAGLDTTSIETFARRTNDGYVLKGPQDLDHHGAGSRQDPDPDAHREEGRRQEADRRHDVVLHRPRPFEGRGAPHSEDGSRGGGFEHGVHRRSIRAGRRSHRRGRQGLSHPARQPQSRTHSDRAPKRSALAATRSARGAKYARERVVFGRPIGQNQGVQHPLAESWMALESAWWLCLRAAALYDSKQPCGAEANAAKFLGARAAFDACTRSMMTHGGMGYAKEYPDRTTAARIHDPAHRAGERAAHSLLHRRECAGLAEVLLSDPDSLIAVSARRRSASCGACCEPCAPSEFKRGRRLVEVCSAESPSMLFGAGTIGPSRCHSMLAARSSDAQPDCHRNGASGVWPTDSAA